MFSYKLLQLPTFDIEEKTIDSIFKKISNIISEDQKGVLNIVFLDADGIKKLNKDYRNIDRATDVLSFHYYDNFSELEADDVAGEIIMCEEKIKTQGIEYGLGEEKEFYKLLIHSILHILGYDHEEDDDYKIMQEFENLIWSEVFEK